jgi:hypothetical protein
VINQPAIKLLRDEKSSNAGNHVDVQYHALREKIEKGGYEVQYIKSSDMIADIFTKALPRPAFEYLRKRIGVQGLRF